MAIGDTPYDAEAGEQNRDGWRPVRRLYGEFAEAGWVRPGVTRPGGPACLLQGFAALQMSSNGGEP